MCDLLLQQRGERDTQTQAILTKLKCAAGEGPGAQGQEGSPGDLIPARETHKPHTYAVPDTYPAQVPLGG